MSKKHLSSQNITTIIIAIVSVIGSVSVAYFAFRGNTAPLELAISATQTAESRNVTSIPIDLTNTKESTTSEVVQSSDLTASSKMETPASVSICPEMTPSQVKRHADQAILFDEAHGNSISLSEERAKQIDPRPEIFPYAGNMAEFLRQENYRIEVRESEPLSQTILSNYDLLVIAVGTLPFGNCEVEAVKEFVEKGGGLLILGDGVPTNRIATLLEPFGVGLTGGLVSIIGVEAFPENFYASNFSGHLAIGNTTRVWFNWGTNVEILDESWSILLSSPENAWLDENQDGIVNEDEPRGPFILGAAREFGRGRIIVYGDNCVWDIYRDTNYPMYLAMVQWAIGDPARISP